MNLDKLMSDWHEAGRAAFEKTYENLNYDEYSRKRAVDRKKYISLDVANSGAFIIEKSNGNVYRLKSKYGVPNKKKLCGHVDTITGEDLHRLRWW